jgi:hypothetical protein
MAETHDPEMSQWYKSGLASLIHAIDRFEKDNRLDDPKVFAEMLHWSFTTFRLVASELAHDERISKAAISKWQNGHAMPSAPTRKIVISWVKTKLQEQLDEIEITQPQVARPA